MMGQWGMMGDWMGVFLPLVLADRSTVADAGLAPIPRPWEKLDGRMPDMY
jgi:hypothetical protein